MLLETMKKEYIERTKDWNYCFEKLTYEKTKLTEEQIILCQDVMNTSIYYMTVIEKILKDSNYDVDNFIKECNEVING